ncbi:hypothetical protein [Rhodoplanes sp. Z2-YC6860]|uniref:hypothetical protein n=1 Tax=Rhodoplanes sp. Z2-YC6860 TaxID=674703 RepID=UPI00082B33F7|nr:hypothetical protein [Rhodoplanes sp. Z2-YC6860]
MAGIYPAIPNNSGSVINTRRITRFPDSIAVTVVVGIWAEPAELAEGDPKSDVTHFCADHRP